MMQTKDIKDVVKAATASGLDGNSIMLRDAIGNINVLQEVPFARIASANLPAGRVLKIQNINSCLVTIRGRQAGRCALWWVSQYEPGTISRTSSVAIFSYGNYLAYTNGPTDAVGGVYITLADGGNNDVVTVVSLTNQEPVIEIVSSVPSDAVRILN